MIFDPGFTASPASALTMRYSTKNTLFELLTQSGKAPAGKKQTEGLVGEHAHLGKDRLAKEVLKPGSCLPKETSSQWLFQEGQDNLDTIMFFFKPNQHFQGKCPLLITPDL